VIALHPMPPVSLQWQHTRNRTFAVLRPSGNAPALAIGDYNATPWSNAAPILVQGGWRWSNAAPILAEQRLGDSDRRRVGTRPVASGGP
jgi:endonuclease/exonuclease/phosphatase (EEP) superfamily protein YafD